MSEVVINVKALDEGFFAEYGFPAYATPESAGLDIRACISTPRTVQPGARELIPTGLALDLQNPYAMWVLVPKSGLGHKRGWVLGNLVGIVDSDYHLEVGVSCWNTSDTPWVIQRGDFICQAILVPILRVQWNPVPELTREVVRTGGWGSTV